MQGGSRLVGWVVGRKALARVGVGAEWVRTWGSAAVRSARAGVIVVRSLTARVMMAGRVGCAKLWTALVAAWAWPGPSQHSNLTCPRRTFTLP